MFCKNCGSVVNENMSFCRNCGTPISSRKSIVLDVVPTPKEVKKGQVERTVVIEKSKMIPILVLGILSVVFYGFIGLILAIVALVLAKKLCKSTGANKLPGIGKIGNILAYVGLGLSIVSVILTVIGAIWAVICSITYGVSLVVYIIGALESILGDSSEILEYLYEFAEMFELV